MLVRQLGLVVTRLALHSPSFMLLFFLSLRIGMVFADAQTIQNDVWPSSMAVNDVDMLLHKTVIASITLKMQFVCSRSGPQQNMISKLHD